MDYFVSATNDIHRIIRERGQNPLTFADVVRLYRIACGALASLVDDSEFHDSIERLRHFTRSQQAEAKAILRETGRFAQFVEVERKMLLSADVNVVTCGGLIQTLHTIRERAAASPIPSPEQVLQDVRNLRLYVCKTSADLDQQAGRRAAAQRIRNGATIVAEGVAGIGVAKLNLGLFAASFGLAAPLSLASAAVGYEAAKVALKKLLDH
jgi:hypothetical protein